MLIGTVQSSQILRFAHPTMDQCHNHLQRVGFRIDFHAGVASWEAEGKIVEDVLRHPMKGTPSRHVRHCSS